MYIGARISKPTTSFHTKNESIFLGLQSCPYENATPPTNKKEREEARAQNVFTGGSFCSRKDCDVNEEIKMKKPTPDR